MRFRSTFCLFFLTVYATFGQLTLVLNSLPANTPPDADIFVAGNFQGWDPGDSAYQLNDMGDGTFAITINPSPGSLSYKFTRGSWPSVEGNENGGFRPNRNLTYSGNTTTVDHTVLSWEDLGGSGGNSTAAWNVSVLHDAFMMPQLNRTRRIWLYLPPDYETSQKNYPVLYMHDGQNVFDVATSFAGEWEVDESLNQLFDQGDYGCIVVAIENGGALRLDEYSPWLHPTYGGGEGDEYISFIVNTLKPFVDDNYRTLPGRETTGMMGSSMGGLISLYAGIEWQEVISKVGSFSPAYWFSNQTYEHATSTGKEEEMRIYTIAGGLESNTLLNGVHRMNDSLISAGFMVDELNQTIHGDGQHSEWYWAREFSDAYTWLFGDLDLSGTEDQEQTSVEIFPNPADNFMEIRGIEQLKQPSFKIISIDGKTMFEGSLTNHQINIQNLFPAVYIIEIFEENKILHKSKFIIER